VRHFTERVKLARLRMERRAEKDAEDIVTRCLRKELHDYYRAREEHAFLLRCEGFTYKATAGKLGVSTERGRDMVMKFSRRLSWAKRHAKIYIHNPLK